MASSLRTLRALRLRSNASLLSSNNAVVTRSWLNRKSVRMYDASRDPMTGEFTTPLADIEASPNTLLFERRYSLTWNVAP